jgi:hypothetical protein
MKAGGGLSAVTQGRVTMKMKTKDELLAHYAKREPKQFVQYDGWADCEGDAVLDSGDGSGYGMATGITHELMRGSNVVRVLIPPDTAPADAVTLLRRIADWIECDGLYGLDGAWRRAGGEEEPAAG